MPQPGETLRFKGDFVQAQRYYRESLFIGSELGDKASVVIGTTNLGHVAVALQNDDEAGAYARQAIRLANELGLTPALLDNLGGYAGVLARAGETEQTLTLLGLVADHPALRSETTPLIEQTLSILRARCSEEQIAAGLAHGKATSLKTVVTEILAEGLGKG